LNQNKGVEFDQCQKELIEKHREINVDHNDWYDYIWEECILEMIKKGINADEMNYSGFCSQGDGASFTGKIDMSVFLKAHDLEHQYQGAVYFASIDELPARLVRSGRYPHEGSITLDMDCDGWNNYNEDDIRHATYDTLYEILQDEWKELEEDVLKICRGYMRDLYRKLEEGYEALTSDEAVWDTIVANDLHVLEAV
jgi:hypothetical protein